MRVKLYMLH